MGPTKRENRKKKLQWKQRKWHAQSKFIKLIRKFNLDPDYQIIVQLGQKWESIDRSSWYKV